MAAVHGLIGQTGWPRRFGCLHQRSARAAKHQKAAAGCCMLFCPWGVRSLAMHAAMPDRAPFSPQEEEYSFSLTQLMVVLDKPIGLSLAPDPTTGHVYVQHVEPGMAAAESRLVLVGDRLLSCSAVFGDEMWHAQDLQRTRWAINNRPGKVKLVLERGGGVLPPWYFKGREGIATWEAPEQLQLPIRFTTPVGGELMESLPGVGRSLTVSFNRCMNPSTAEQARPHVLRPGLLARRERAEQLTRQLLETTASPTVDISSPISRLLAGRDGARFQFGGTGSTPLPTGGTTNVLPFRRHGSSSSGSSGSSTPNPNSSSGSSNNNSIGNSSSAPGIGTPGQSSNTNTAQSNGNSSGIVSTGDATGSSSSSSSSGTGGVGNGSSKQSSSMAALAAAAAAAAAWGGSVAGPGGGVVPMREKKVVQVLPWLLVSNGRLNSADLTRLATTRALGCLLEMRLTLNHEGLLCPVGSQPPPFSLPAAPVPPTLSPSTTPAPAPVEPPPFPAGQQQQQQEEEQQQQQDQQQQQPQVDAGALSAGLVGSLGLGVGPASAATAAAAAAAAAVPGADGQNPSNSSSSSSSSMEPSQLTLQAHAILHCIADLHRLAMRRQCTPKGGTAWRQQLYQQPPSPFAPGTSPYLPRQQQRQQQQGVGLGLGLGSSTSGSTLSPGSGSGVTPLPGVGSSAASSSSSSSSTTSSSGGSSSSGALGFRQPSSQLLLSCDEGAWGVVGLMLVAWLHWHCGVCQATAVQCVSQALGVTLNEAVLSEVQRLLVVRAKERFSRLMLTWAYGGGSAEVSGDLVGGWTERVAMRRCLSPDGCLGASKGHFYLELKGLHPGRYHYKFIIDNNWDVDPEAPKTLDSSGNWNNVLDVTPPPSIDSLEEQAHFAALQAMCMAFEHKARIVSSIGGD